MLLCILDHPTQYDPPLWRAMTRAGRQRPVVWYVRPTPPADDEIGQAVSWRADDGFEHRDVPLSALGKAFRDLRPRPSVVLVSGWRRPATWRVAPSARALGIPVVVCTDRTLNEPSPGGLVGFGRTAFHALRARAFGGFFTTGSLGTEYLASIGCPRERIATGLYPVDVASWQEARRRLRERSHALRAEAHGAATVVLAVCKLSERENPLALLDGFARFRRAAPGAALLHVGDGPLRPAFEARVRELDLERSVRCAGYVPYRQLAAYYGAADLFVHTPRSEPWGISVLEAMACGIPVVAATTVGSAADLVIHGRTGALVYPDDATSIASGLELVARNAVEMGTRASEAVRRFDVSVVAETLADFVELLPRASSRPESLASVLGADVRNQFARWSL